MSSDNARKLDIYFRDRSGQNVTLNQKFIFFGHTMSWLQLFFKATGQTNNRTDLMILQPGSKTEK